MVEFKSSSSRCCAERRAALVAKDRALLLAVMLLLLVLLVLLVRLVLRWRRRRLALELRSTYQPIGSRPCVLSLSAGSSRRRLAQKRGGLPSGILP